MDDASVYGWFSEGFDKLVEFEQVVEIVGRWPDHFPPETLAALRDRRRTPSLEPSAACVSPDVAPSQPAARVQPSTERMRRTRVRRFAELGLRRVEVL